MADDTKKAHENRYRRADRYSKEEKHSALSGGKPTGAVKDPKTSLPALTSFKVKKYRTKNTKSAEEDGVQEEVGESEDFVSEAAINDYVESLEMKVKQLFFLV
jgi:hypothetical protein